MRIKLIKAKLIRAKGFTLVEMVMTTVVLGIIFLGITGFIEYGTRGYVDTIDRQKLQNQARFVIEKLSREIRHAVPNSFEVITNGANTKCLNFYPIERSGFYTQSVSSGKVEFVVNNQGGRFSSPVTESLVINPSRIEDLTDSDHFKSLSGCRDSGDSTCEETEPSSGVYIYSVNNSFTSHSIANRYFTYQQMVAYCITSTGAITRNNVIVGDGINFAQSSFSYSQPSLQRGGLVHLDFLFTNQAQDEQSFYKHDVQVLNVP